MKPDGMSWPVFILLSIWTLGMPLYGHLNRDGVYHGPNAPGRFDGHLVVWAKWWPGTYHHVAWPVIYVNPSDADGVIWLETLHHERRHLQQMVVFGPAFLPLYGLNWLLRFLTVNFLDWEGAYRGIVFEWDARAYAARQMEKHGLEAT